MQENSPLLRTIVIADCKSDYCNVHLCGLPDSTLKILLQVHNYDIVTRWYKNEHQCRRTSTGSQ